ncbi:MAG: SDR family NAD(P)-dependent oxidoreductase [Desulfomonile tiedjei]|uniref:SDR family NAD(P)-dependent oxidoreductase n=1 Tax=Desulfomonile tiedjei TaxID=2358 RepID=A0A9D6VBD1_9BACT|nr:SDR family NAD(P)-dependent oxidoreductase [Desulfomonile tiedjei]
MRLEEKVAIVTGASRGIGKAIAVGLAREGASVVLAARSEIARADGLAGTIHETATAIEELGGKVLPVKCDVTDEASVTAMVKTAMATFHRIDILVNNAGVAFFYPIAETPLKRWETVLKVNLTGAFLCARAVLPLMADQKSGSIINISSLAADERDGGTVPTGVAYAVAKAGLDRFTWGLAVEAGKHNIAVNCLKPKQPVDTEGMRFWTTDGERNGWASADKMVKCGVFLAAQDASGVTGTVATDEELSLWHGL